MPDAGGLVIAGDHETARAYAGARCAGISGERSTVVLSGRPHRQQEDHYRSRQSTARWMVAVRMVSEGVDVPRLAVGVYADQRVSTPLFFAQAVGRFVQGPQARRDRVGVRAVRAVSAVASPPSLRPSVTIVVNGHLEKDPEAEPGSGAA